MHQKMSMMFQALVFLFLLQIFGIKATLYEEYIRDGFVVVKNFVSDEECLAMMNRMESLIEKWNPDENVMSVFRTDKDQEKAQGSDSYFLDSADQIHFFLEPGATDNETGRIKNNIEKRLALNKVGHGLHLQDSVFKEYSHSNKMKSLVRSLGLTSAVVPQSMYIFKQPFHGGEITSHQDSTFLWTEPKQTCVGLWLALEDADEENGCLWARPGSHLEPVRKKFARNPEYFNNSNVSKKDVPMMVFQEQSQVEVEVEVEETSDGQQSITKSKNDNIQNNGDDQNKEDVSLPQEEAQIDYNTLFHSLGFVPLKVRRGDLVAFPGTLDHLSAPNTSPRSRHTFQLHIVEGPEAGVEWSKSNWLQYKDYKPFDHI
mmetsp:Transcript_2193/g.2720  ORF Transcript_2193/g.2720 Transcript_2193/m.2720 type:complete len:372 (-) Transcript_2193:313-1428(-)